jgi:hypothetical protein
MPLLRFRVNLHSPRKYSISPRPISPPLNAQHPPLGDMLQVLAIHQPEQVRALEVAVGELYDELLSTCRAKKR